jgi:hypothetical protein
MEQPEIGSDFLFRSLSIIIVPPIKLAASRPGDAAITMTGPGKRPIVRRRRKRSAPGEHPAPGDAA